MREDSFIEAYKSQRETADMPPNVLKALLADREYWRNATAPEPNRATNSFERAVSLNQIAHYGGDPGQKRFEGPTELVSLRRDGEEELLNDAAVASKQGNFRKADKILQELLNAGNLKQTRIEGRTELISLRRDAETDLLKDTADACKQGNFKKAEKILQELLQLQKNTCGEKSVEVATTFVLLGRVCHSDGKIKDAKDYFKQGADTATAAFKTKNNALTALNIARMARMERLVRILLWLGLPR
jgi:tetratricopeptide (TPR) repeat protein